jgi:hypothetical protein
MFGSIALSWESMKVAAASDHGGFPLKELVCRLAGFEEKFGGLD